MSKDKNSAVTEVVDARKQVLFKQLSASINLMREEMRNTSKQASNNAAEALAEMRQYKDLLRLNKKGELSPEQAKRLLRAVNDSRKAVLTLQQRNRKADGNKGIDGKTITERLRERNAELATQESVVDILREINERREKHNDDKANEHRNLKNTFRQGLSAFLGPAGPLVEMFAQLKDEYGEDAKKIGNKVKSWLKIEKDLLSEYEREGRRAERRDSKLFGMLSDKFRKFSGLLGGLGGGLLDKIGGLFGWGGKAGKGKGGVFTKIKRMARKIPGVGKLMRGGGLGRFGGKILGGIGRIGRGVLGLGGKLLGPLGVALGVGSILGDKDAGAKGEDALDTGMSYGGGALTGASAGAMIGSVFPVVGTAIGGAIGAVVGLLFTGVVRNWTAFKTKISNSWDGIVSFSKTAWGKVKDFGSDFLDFTVKTYEGLSDGFKKTVTWMRDNVPGFDRLMRFAENLKVNAGKALDAGRELAGNAKAKAIAAGQNIAEGTKKVAAYTSQKAQDFGQAVADTATDAKVAVAGATQTAANAVSQTLEPIAQKNPDSMLGSAASTLSKSAQGVAAFTGKLAMPNTDIKSAILGAADKIGVDKGYMLAQAAQESSFNPNAKAGTSSASGLYQFIDSTWAQMVKQYGKQYGIGMGDRFDPQKNAVMGALFARDNANTLKGQGHDVNAASLYAAHMLGSGGANTLLSALKNNPNASAADLLPKAAKSNYNIFYNKDGSKKSVKDVYAFYQNKIESKAMAYNNALGSDSDTRVASKGDTYNAGKDSASAYSSVAPQTDGYTRAESVAPSANVAVTAPPQETTANGGVASLGNNQQVRTNDIPMVLGENHMVVLNAGMFGA